MTRGIYKAIIKEFRRTLSPAKRRSSYLVRFHSHYPFKEEKKLQSLLNRLFKWYTRKVFTVIMKWAHIYPVQSVRRDSFESEIRDFTEDLKKESLPPNLVASLNLAPLVNAIMAEIKKISEDDLEEYFIKRFGKPLPYTDPWWETVKQKWIADLDVRVGGSADAYLQRVQSTVLEYVQNERTFDELVAKIQSISDTFTEKQAQFLARDLTGKLNSEMKKELHTGIGLNYYYWQTAADERVRGRPGGRYPNAIPSHWDMDGKVCSWLNNAIVSYDYGKTWQQRTANMPFLPPGMDWQCRCQAVPFDLDLLKEVDKELNGERGSWNG